MKRKTYIASAIATALVMSAPLAYSGNYDANKSETSKEEVQAKNLWREAKIESLLLVDTDLNNFSIDVEVEKEEAVLDGFVDSDTERDLAEEIAKSVSGIESVDNNLKIDKEIAEEWGNKSALKDASITAKVNMQLFANDDLSAFDIDVDTEKQVVTLKGEVDSKIKSKLAEKIAANIEQVKSVENELEIVSS